MRCKDGSGHTLLELLVVISVLATVVTIVGVNAGLRNSTDRSGEAESVIRILHETRAEAARRGSPIRLRALRDGTLARETATEWLVLSGEELRGATFEPVGTSITFWPDGTASGSPLTIADADGRRVRLRLSALEGRVSVASD